MFAIRCGSSCWGYVCKITDNLLASVVRVCVTDVLGCLLAEHFRCDVVREFLVNDDNASPDKPQRRPTESGECHFNHG